MKEKTLLLFSAGKESLYNLYEAKDKIDLMVVVDYGQVSIVAETVSAKYYSDLFGIPYEVLKVDTLHKSGYLFTGKDLDYPNTVIPFRNSVILFTVANNYYDRGFRSFILGFFRPFGKQPKNLEDGHLSYKYPANSILSEMGCRVWAPTENKTLSSIVSYLYRNADLSHMISCFSPTEDLRPCNSCKKCVTMRGEIYPLRNGPDFLRSIGLMNDTTIKPKKPVFYKARKLKERKAVIVHPGFLSPAECKYLRDLLDRDSVESVIEGHEGKRHTYTELRPSACVDHFYTRSLDLVNQYNKSNFKFGPVHLSEEAYINKYSADSGEYRGWHVDGLTSDVGGMSPYVSRKLSLVVQLSDPSEYTGGELKFIEYHNPPKESGVMLQGTAIIFPSFEWHKIEPVLSGSRYSFVLFTHGEPFK